MTPMLNLVDRLSNPGHPEFMSRTQAVRADDLAAAAIRPVRPADLAALRDFFTGLSAQTRYLRFFGPVTPNAALLHLLSGAAANVDAVVAIRAGLIVGHAMAVDGTDPEDRSGARVTDIGVVVADAWQGRGLGSALVRALVARAQARGVTSLGMDVLHANPRALAMIKGHWPAAGLDVSPDCVTVRIPLPQDEPRRPSPRRVRPAGPAAGRLRGDSIRDHDHSTRRRRDGVLRVAT
jgi:ribosomal protein S18 acetylase RimI-like enzyme